MKTDNNFVKYYVGITLLDFSPISKADNRPNVIIIYADDLGYGDLSSYGGDIP